MNPFDVQKIISQSRENGERLVVEELSRRCGVRLRHAHVRLSKDMFEYEAGGGFPRHWVRGVSLYGWISLWRYVPPKQTDFSRVRVDGELKPFSELSDIVDLRPGSDDKK